MVEVEINGFTGEHFLRQVDITHDCGNSLLPNIDIGQIEGAFAQATLARWRNFSIVPKATSYMAHQPTRFQLGVTYPNISKWNSWKRHLKTM